MKSAGRFYAAQRPRRVMVLGSGGLTIGQAGEFDYSGSQAIKALKEEGIYTVLVNPNIATIQTSEELADAVYFLPIDAHFVEQVIAKERVDGILLGFGGQTALNCGLALDKSGVLQRHGVRVLGTPVSTIRTCGDRDLFRQALDEIDIRTARSRACASIEEGIRAAAEIGYPVMLRAAFALGGKGSAIVTNEDQCRAALARAFVGVPQVLVEESVAGWKEVEYEVVRDGADNCITVCNMENVDPMGIHTGESIVVAPTQTLNDEEYQLLRDIAIKVIRKLGIVGECNIQYALDPNSTQYRVIEVNSRLSRSSALASKATGYPLAYVAAKIGLGYTLPELANAVTRCTSAFFEPALDYLVCKVPRWDLEKFVDVDPQIGTEMKSVGEVMAIGRTFGETLQKALRMLEIGVQGLDPDAFRFDDLARELKNPTPRRIFAVAQAFERGMSVDELFELTRIDRFFLAEAERIVQIGRSLSKKRCEELGRPELLSAKREGFSDRQIAARTGATAERVRERRVELGLRPHLSQIDTLAAEYPAQTNYLYLTYAAGTNDVARTDKKKILVLGSGCYRIGSSVEFDWCSVSAVRAAQELGYETLMLNCNPETVSTDYDMCDRLVFDEISVESVLELAAHERPDGVIVSMGGQTPNNIALQLHRAGVPIVGTAADSIDRAENRKKFSDLLDEIGVQQPRWSRAVELSELDRVVAELGGYPVLVRPSYVLSGAAMRVAHAATELTEFLSQATRVSPEHPVVISKFERHSREVELDAVADRGRIVLWAISEHIEDAGVHSGDATLVIPPQGLYVETIRQVREIGRKIARALNVTGPFNIQFLARHNAVKVIECNLRASRSFPFISKALGVNFIREATRIMLGHPSRELPEVDPLDLGHVAVKAAQFSFRRLTGADPRLGVEMASTGEVACFGDDREEALLKSMIATGFRFPSKGVLLSLGPTDEKYRFTEEARILAGLGLKIYATAGTAEVLKAEGIECSVLEKEDGPEPRAIDYLSQGKIDLVINIPRGYDERGRPDGYRIRRVAVDLEIPLITELWLARRVVQALGRYRLKDLKVKSWGEYLAEREARPVESAR
jgi:carbamoyl-phosphate synthase large subunit